MNDAQLRRRELLRQTKQLYGERETVPPIILVMAIYVKNKTKAVKKQAEAFICGL
mgnify:CR=1 FL=1